MDFSNYKFRCHYQGTLVSVPKPLTQNQKETLEAYRLRMNGEGRPLTEKQKADWHSLEYKENESNVYKLTDTAKTMLTDIVFYEKTGREYILENKYFAKGLAVEKEARDLVSRVTGQLLVKDDERKTNEWVTGKRDVKHDKLIIDIKSSFNFKSFNKHLLESQHENYFRQLDCYMELWGIEDALIAYTLVNTPYNIIDDEIKRIAWKNNIMTFDGTILDEAIPEVVRLVKEHIYTYEALEAYCQQSPNIYIEWFDDFVEIPEAERLHLVPHFYDKIRIEQRNECLSLAREFMNSIKPMNNITIIKN